MMLLAKRLTSRVVRGGRDPNPVGADNASTEAVLVIFIFFSFFSVWHLICPHTLSSMRISGCFFILISNALLLLFYVIN